MIQFQRWDDVISHVRAGLPIRYKTPTDVTSIPVKTEIKFRHRIKVTPIADWDFDSFVCGADHLERFWKQNLVFEGIEIRPKPLDPKCPYKQSTEYYIMGQSQGMAWAHKPSVSLTGARWEEALSNLAEGGYIIDERHSSFNNIKYPFDPSDDSTLDPMSINVNGGRTITFNSFDEFFGRIKNESLCLMYVSLDLYAEFWRRQGAKIGRKIASQIYWKDNYVTV